MRGEVRCTCQERPRSSFPLPSLLPSLLPSPPPPPSSPPPFLFPLPLPSPPTTHIDQCGIFLLELWVEGPGEQLPGHAPEVLWDSLPGQVLHQLSVLGEEVLPVLEDVAPLLPLGLLAGQQFLYVCVCGGGGGGGGGTIDGSISKQTPNIPSPPPTPHPSVQR